MIHSEPTAATPEPAAILTPLDLERRLAKLQRVVNLVSSYSHWREIGMEADTALNEIRGYLQRGDGQ